MGKVSSTLAITGTSFEESLGMLTAITEITRNASMASRGLRQISSRLTQTLDESSSTGQKLIQIYDGLGIALTDSQGQIRSTYDILADLAKQWDSLSTNEQEYIALTSAGSNQVQNFTALMNNFGKAVEATTTAQNSAGSATRENAAYMESLEAKVQGLKAAWQELVTEGGTINKFIKLILDAGTAVLKFADSDIGRLLLKTTALTVGFKLLSNPVTKLFSLIKGSPFGTFIKILSTAGVNANTLQFAFTALNDVMIANPLFWGAAIFAGFGLLEYLTSTERQIKKLGETLNENTTQLQDYSAEIEELESKEGDLTSAEQARLQWLKDQTEELERQNQELIEQIDLEQNRQTTERGYGTHEGGGYGTAGGIALGYQEVDDTSAIDRAKQNLEEAKSIEDLTEATQDFVKSKIDLAKQAEDSGAAISEETQEILNLYNSLHDVSDATQDASDSASTTAQEFSNLANSESSVADTTRQALNSLAEENSQMISNWNSMQDLVAAETQLRNGQKLSEAQIQALIAKYPALRSQIDAMRNGELAAAEAIHAVGVQSLGTSKTVIANSKKEADAAVANARREVKAQQAIVLALAAKKARDDPEVLKAQQKLSEASAALQEALNAQSLYTEAVYYGTEVTVGNTGATSSNTGATSSNTSSKDKASDAEQKLKEEIAKTTDALKDQTDAIKNAADYMVDKIDEQIDKLKSNKDAVNDYYDAWIDKLKDTNEELEDQIELENALQKLAEAKSKKVRVYKDGGFAYVSDTQAVSEAQREVSTIQSKRAQEDLIEELEKARERDLASVDKQIASWEKEKSTWEKASKSYDDYLATQALGIDKEGKNWSKRLGQAKTYTNDYLKLMKAIDDVESGKITPAAGQKIVTNVSSDIKNLPTGTSALKSKVDTSSPVSSFSPVEKVVKTTSSGATTINVANVTLPNVTNPTEFIADLQDFARYASQSASSR